jgi:hypothetical protein
MVNLDHFSIVDTGHSTRNATKSWCPFNFVGQDSNTLVVTVGDSWTWGCDMTPDDNEDHRLKHHYGRTIADHLAADWLNLGQGGAGNFWICDKVKELALVIPTWDYKKIYVICTFTEIGRAINSRQDIDFYNFFQTQSLDQLLPWLNDLCVERITGSLSQCVNVQLVIGTNFVDWTGATYDFLIKPCWVELLSRQCGIDYDHQCHVVSSWVFDEFSQLSELTKDSVEFKNLLHSWLDAAIDRANLIRKIPAITRTLSPATGAMLTGHPNAAGHKVWAEAILSHLGT